MSAPSHLLSKKFGGNNSKVNGSETPRTVGFFTPKPDLSFRRELRQVLQERNLLTENTRNKVCSMLESDDSPRPPARTLEFSPCNENDSVHASPASRQFDSALNSPSYRNCMSSPVQEHMRCNSLRLQAIREILTSEKTYLQHLNVLITYFVRPLKEQLIIDDSIHQMLFGQIEMIYNLNQEFLKELESSLHNVARAFLKMAPFFKLYSVYAFDYRTALVVLQEQTSKNAAFRRFLEQHESRPEVQRKLNSLLIEPIQRVPRYKLLLQQVLQYTSPSHVDYKLLKESIKEIEATAAHIDACVLEQEVTQALINLQNSLIQRMPNIVKPSRKVLLEGTLSKITRSGAEMPRFCVVMSDIFMYGRLVKDRAPKTLLENSIECSCIFPLRKSKVYELFPRTFKITCLGDGIIFSAKDAEECRSWVGCIQQAIDEIVLSRQTLRKESSKRKPMRKKEIKNFDVDEVLSPRRRSDYESVFRSANCSSGSENDSVEIGCLGRPGKRPAPAQLEGPRPKRRFIASSLSLGEGIMARFFNTCKRSLANCSKRLISSLSIANNNNGFLPAPSSQQECEGQTGTLAGHTLLMQYLEQKGQVARQGNEDQQAEQPEIQIVEVEEQQQGTDFNHTPIHQANLSSQQLQQRAARRVHFSPQKPRIYQIHDMEGTRVYPRRPIHQRNSKNNHNGR